MIIYGPTIQRLLSNRINKLSYVCIFYVSICLCGKKVNLLKQIIMKIACHHILMLAVIVTGISCKKDNYAAPGSQLSGRVVYKGEAINVEYNQVPFELYQYGFGKTGAITATFAPDGSYSHLLFDGEYKFIIPNGQGPFKWKQTAQGAPDTTSIIMKGNQTLDIEVTPYY